MLDAAKEYLRFARDKLGADLGETTDQTFDALESMAEIRFLFPNLGEDSLELIRALECSRWGAVIAISKPPAGGPHPIKAANSFEASFAAIKHDLQHAGILEKLSPIQRRLLEQRYMSLRLRENN